MPYENIYPWILVSLKLILLTSREAVWLQVEGCTERMSILSQCKYSGVNAPIIKDLCFKRTQRSECIGYKSKFGRNFIA